MNHGIQIKPAPSNHSSAKVIANVNDEKIVAALREIFLVGEDEAITHIGFEKWSDPCSMFVCVEKVRQ